MMIRWREELRIRAERRKGLRRFHEAQKPVWERVLVELGDHGRKSSHWMWFMFPQAKGLGQSSMSRIYALSRREAREYLADDTLRLRLLILTVYVGRWTRQGRSLEEVFGPLDAMKFRSSMALFYEASDHDERFNPDLYERKECHAA